MSATTKIEWCDSTFNPWIGCSKVSPGCAHCYAATLDAQRYSKTLGGGTKAAPISHWGPGAPRHRTSTWSDPRRWNKAAAESLRGEGLIARPRVFCASLADWLDDEVPIAWLSDLLCLFRATPHLDWLLLTKRPQNWRPLMETVSLLDDIGAQVAREWLAGRPLPNLWLGTTVEDQIRADERIPLLLSIPAHIRFLSCEPLLEPVDLTVPAFNGTDSFGSLEGLHWVICGGESGPGARPMHPDWARSLRDQCQAAGVPFFFKQWGDWLPEHQEMERARPAAAAGLHTFSDGVRAFRVGKLAAGALLDGVEYREFPKTEVIA